MLLEGAAVTGVRALRACWWRCKVLLSGWCVRFGAGMLVPMQSAAARCSLRVLLLEWRVRFPARTAAGCCLRVLLSEWCALSSRHAGAAGGCCCMLLQGAAGQVVCVLCVCVRARFGVGMLVAVQGAAAGCCFRCCCQSRVCALALAAGAAAWFCC